MRNLASLPSKSISENAMRIIFMGSPKFGADILYELAQVHDVICVFTQPDRIRSRGSEVLPTPVKQTALALGIEVLTPSTLKDEGVIDTIKALDADLICVAAYGMLLPEEVLCLPRYGCFNVHASLLPRWRGAAPVERAILAGDEQAGVCIMRMEAGLDTGDYCIIRSIPIAGMNASKLTDELASLGAQALISACAQVEADALKWNRQDEQAVTYANRIEKGELDLSPELSVSENLRHIQASSSSYPAKAQIGKRHLAVIAAHADDAYTGVVKQAQSASCNKQIVLGCAGGVLVLDTVKPDGKKEMRAEDFLSGFQQLREGELPWS